LWGSERLVLEKTAVSSTSQATCFDEVALEVRRFAHRLMTVGTRGLADGGHRDGWVIQRAAETKLGLFKLDDKSGMIEHLRRWYDLHHRNLLKMTG
jgi:hypothetical protein